MLRIAYSGPGFRCRARRGARPPSVPLSLVLLAVLLPPSGPLAAQDAPPGAEADGPVFTFEQVHEDVYLARPTGELVAMSNAAIVINDEDVLIVDSHVTPAAAHMLLEELREITDKPVRYVVNTHFHFDHAHGNQIYPSNIEVIGHEFTREMLESGATLAGRTYDRFLAGVPGRVHDLQTRLEETTDPGERAALERTLRIQENYLAALEAVRPTPPNLTINHRMTLFRGDREIRLAFFGRGHTGGDVVVHLPQERLLVTGDLLLAGLPYMGDAYIPDWIETLERLKELDFETILPGHGAPFSDRGVIDNLQAYLADLWGQVVELHQAGVSAAEAAERIDLRDHADNYPNLRSVGADAQAVERAYELLDGGF